MSAASGVGSTCGDKPGHDAGHVVRGERKMLQAIMNYHECPSVMRGESQSCIGKRRDSYATMSAALPIGIPSRSSQPRTFVL
jgi:hypothetical protein